MTIQQLKLNGAHFQALFLPSELEKLDQKFLDYLKNLDSLLYEQLLAYRRGQIPSAMAISQLLIDCAPILESFIAELFQIEDAVGELQALTLKDQPIFAFKKYYVLRCARRVANAKSNEEFLFLNQFIEDKIIEKGLDISDRELAVAQWGVSLLEDPIANQNVIEKIVDWCAAVLTTELGMIIVQDWEMFHLPKHLNYENLVNKQPVNKDSLGRFEGSEISVRDGFELTDPRMNSRQVLNEIDYCVYCHKNEGDFCSKGFPVKKTAPSLGLKTNPVGQILTGCPLEEKISEMHVLKKMGYGVAALAVIMVDNPMCPMTGHRICNDCMKACIYQKQDPVNIPQTETHILTDVLHLPWGVEIYDLLTRWNPLRASQWVAKPYNGFKVLVMGMGPAGFSLAHHLLMEGFAVVGTEGLKIEPLPKKYLQQPIYDYNELVERLDERIMNGFGGVAEYGITVRWDKNFLKLIYISLMRRPYFQVFGGIRFGGSLTVEDAWYLGFSHLALAVGAGLPKELAIKNSLAPGMRQANEFLMGLQLTGVAKKSSLANLQIRLPAVVIGGGLTGIDTATELQAYYIVQVEKIKKRYQILVNHYSEQYIREKFSQLDLEILDEFLNHAQMIQAEREQAAQENRQPTLLSLLRQWGGVTIVYRRSMQESPAYTRNHEELQNALSEGVYYAEGLEPHALLLDEHGQTKALQCRWRILDEEGRWHFTDELQTVPARAVLVATGARLNVAYEFEHRGTFARSNSFEYQRYEMTDKHLHAVNGPGHVKIDHFGPLTSYQQDHHAVSFLGDTHPIFHGSVVNAIASAKRIYPKISSLLLKNNSIVGDDQEYQQFRLQIAKQFQAKIIQIKRIHEKVVELTVRAPLAARNFQPGQFYRVQNYECLSQLYNETRLQTESLALLGIPNTTNPDLLSFLVIERGASSRLVATFQPGDHILVMGPTGAKEKLSPGQTIMVVGDMLAIPYLLAIAPELRALQNRVIFVGYFTNKEEIYYQDRLEELADVIIWVMKNGDPITEFRSQDYSEQNDLISAIRQYALQAQQSTSGIKLSEIDQVKVIGCSSLLRIIENSKNTLLKDLFSTNVTFTASVYGTMQCMLKGVCAQCLQWQIDPKTGKRSKAVYACSWQHQPLEKVDIDNLDQRLQQNRCQEILTNLWLDYLFEQENIERV